MKSLRLTESRNLPTQSTELKRGFGPGPSDSGAHPSLPLSALLPMAPVSGAPSGPGKLVLLLGLFANKPVSPYVEEGFAYSHLAPFKLEERWKEAGVCRSAAFPASPPAMPRAT